jgi:hypothetical protein
LHGCPGRIHPNEELIGTSEEAHEKKENTRRR